MEKAGGILLLLAAAFIGVAASMTTMELTDLGTFLVFTLAGVLALTGVWLTMRGKPSTAPENKPRIVLKGKGSAVVSGNQHSGPSSFAHSEQNGPVAFEGNKLNEPSDKDR